jgi:hypothetical protein
MGRIDDKFDAEESLIEADIVAEPAEFVTDALAAIEIVPGAGIVKHFIERKRAANRDALLQLLKRRLDHLMAKIEELEQQYQVFLREDWMALVVDGLNKAEDIRDQSRIERIANILAHAAEKGPDSDLNEAEEMTRIATELGDNEVYVLRDLVESQIGLLEQAWRPMTDPVNNAWAKKRPSFPGRETVSDLYTACAKLERFGLVTRVERNNFKLGVNEIPYALLKRGYDFTVWIEHERESEETSNS